MMDSAALLRVITALQSSVDRLEARLGSTPPHTLGTPAAALEKPGHSSATGDSLARDAEPHHASSSARRSTPPASPPPPAPADVPPSATTTALRLNQALETASASVLPPLVDEPLDAVRARLIDELTHARARAEAYDAARLSIEAERKALAAERAEVEAAKLGVEAERTLLYVERTDLEERRAAPEPASAATDAEADPMGERYREEGRAEVRARFKSAIDRLNISRSETRRMREQADADRRALDDDRRRFDEERTAFVGAVDPAVLFALDQAQHAIEADRAATDADRHALFLDRQALEAERHAHFLDRQSVDIDRAALEAAQRELGAKERQVELKRRIADETSRALKRHREQLASRSGLASGADETGEGTGEGAGDGAGADAAAVVHSGPSDDEPDTKKRRLEAYTHDSGRASASPVPSNKHNHNAMLSSRSHEAADVTHWEPASSSANKATAPPAVSKKAKKAKKAAAASPAPPPALPSPNAQASAQPSAVGPHLFPCDSAPTDDPVFALIPNSARAAAIDAVYALTLDSAYARLDELVPLLEAARPYLADHDLRARAINMPYWRLIAQGAGAKPVADDVGPDSVSSKDKVSRVFAVWVPWWKRYMETMPTGTAGCKQQRKRMRKYLRVLAAAGGA
ncbi:hypothetical protein Q5752_000190 [Cryptotrichosporon argae]